MGAADLGINLLDACWVCGEVFTDRGGTADREEHHVVPKQAGGVDGPQVSLCGRHHVALHKMAYRIPKRKSVFEFTRGESEESVKKLIWLATRVANAFAAVKNDKNKLRFASVTLGAKHTTMVDKLKHIYPKAKSREAVLLIALESLYSRHFTS